ncbi:MAG TPA: NAD(P)-binding domain-containing protein [Balneolaceae bacterium]|nr:NAD(P)-binding domain-containing protein [Balneolaceae bacterium]
MDIYSVIIWSTAIILFLLFAIPFLRSKKEIERRTDEAEIEALKYGLKEPVSLHPVVDPDACIGSGSCIAACPEEDVLGLRNGQAVPVAPARCVGHGLCERSCPVDAIQLVFGTEKRGVDIPRIQGNFETNIPGIYIIGELGGMGLIRNAFTQARECIGYIIKEKHKQRDSVLDAVIVGCGPAGLSATIHCKEHNLDTVTLEQEEIGGSIRSYPRKKVVMTQPLEIPGYGKIHKHEIQKEELMETWFNVIDQLDLNIKTGERVKHIQRLDERLFKVITNESEFITHRVLLAIGRRGTPRKLGIEGENLPNVAYSLRDSEQFQDNRITVVGGGDSAVEAALSLAEQPSNTVRISYRKEQFFRIKPQNHDRIEQANDENRIEVIYNSEVVKNTEDRIYIREEGEETYSLPNDFLFIFIGGTLPMKLLEELDVQIDTKFGAP